MIDSEIPLSSPREGNYWQKVWKKTLATPPSLWELATYISAISTLAAIIWTAFNFVTVMQENGKKLNDLLNDHDPLVELSAKSAAILGLTNIMSVNTVGALVINLKQQNAETRMYLEIGEYQYVFQGDGKLVLNKNIAGHPQIGIFKVDKP